MADSFDSLEPAVPRAPATPPMLAESPADPATPTPLPPTDWWRETPIEPAPQWSLGELFMLTAGASLAAAAGRIVAPQLLAAALSLPVILGWMRLYLNDWEPRWAVVTWRTLLAGYLTTVFVVAAQQWSGR